MTTETHPEFREFVDDLIKRMTLPQKTLDDVLTSGKALLEMDENTTEEEFKSNLSEVKAEFLAYHSGKSIEYDVLAELSTFAETQRENNSLIYHIINSSVGIQERDGIDGKTALHNVVSYLNDQNVLQPPYELSGLIPSKPKLETKHADHITRSSSVTKALAIKNQTIETIVDELDEHRAEHNIDSIEVDDKYRDITIWYEPGYARDSVIQSFSTIDLDQTIIKEKIKTSFEIKLPFQNLEKILLEEVPQLVMIDTPSKVRIYREREVHRSALALFGNPPNWEFDLEDEAASEKHRLGEAEYYTEYNLRKEGVIRENIKLTQNGINNFFDNLGINKKVGLGIIASSYNSRINLRNPVDITTLEDTGVLHPLDPEITEKNYDIVSRSYNTLIKTMKVLNNQFYLSSPEEYSNINEFKSIGGHSIDEILDQYDIYENLDFNKKAVFGLYSAMNK